jgi:hypothetical protein
MKSVDVNLHQPSFWQLVFLQSKVNGAAYNGEALPRRSWDWPKNTYLQRRLGRRGYPHGVENARFN